MAALDLQQRCSNHEAREAVCRCPACGRSFCRECVAEHEGRLLCAACLKAALGYRRTQRAGIRWLLPAGMIVAGLLLAWLFFLGAGEAVVTIVRRLEQQPL